MGTPNRTDFMILFSPGFIYLTVRSEGFEDRKYGRGRGPMLAGKARAYIKVNRREYSPRRRGINVVVIKRTTGKILHFMIWLNWYKVKRSIMIGSLSVPNSSLLYGPLRGTTHELNSPICVLEKRFKRKHFDVKEKPFLLSDQKFWQKFCENGVIKTNFLVL